MNAPDPQMHTITLGAKIYFYSPFTMVSPWKQQLEPYKKSFTFRYCSVRCIKLQSYKSYVDF